MQLDLPTYLKIDVICECSLCYKLVFMAVFPLKNQLKLIIFSGFHQAESKKRTKYFSPYVQKFQVQCSILFYSITAARLKGHSLTTLTRLGRQVVLELLKVLKQLLISVMKFLHKCQQGVGRESMMGKILSTQFVNGPLTIHPLHNLCMNFTSFARRSIVWYIQVQQYTKYICSSMTLVVEYQFRSYLQNKEDFCLKITQIK